MDRNDLYFEPKLSEKDIKRFWNHVFIKSDNECWLWKTGFSKRPGFTVNYTRYTVSRLAYFIHNGPFLAKFEVLHSCDNQRCVNVKNHLRLGTHSENIKEAYDRGLISRPKLFGLDNPSGKLSDEDIKRILFLYYKDHLKQEDIAEIFKVSQGTISDTVLGYRHKNLLEEFKRKELFFE